MGEPSTIAERVYAAYGSGDLDGCLRLFAPDCQVTFPGMPPLTGPEQLRPFLQVQLTAFPTGQHRVRRMIEQGSSVAVELVFSGEQNGPYPTPSGAIPPSGRQVSFESVDIVEVNAGRIASWRIYLDTASMMAQMGANPAMAAA
ncbi:MAG TPA: ester cyclase [Chloroflexota bacterium]|nr:ester cyclase [Chloroflexota bacterium]